jgi:hypothetical protein
MGKDARVRARMRYAAHILVRSSQTGTVKGTVRDISIDSVYLYLEHRLKIGEKVNMEIILLGEDSQLSIKVSGRVVRLDAEGAALCFLKPLEWWPVFSVFPLHNLDNKKKSRS